MLTGRQLYLKMFNWTNSNHLSEQVQGLKNILLSQNTVAKCVSDNENDLRDQLRRSNKIFQSYSVSADTAQLAVPNHSCNSTSVTTAEL